jgi:hypothetical protein
MGRGWFVQVRQVDYGRAGFFAEKEEKYLIDMA